MYLALPDAADEPGKRLVGFDRIELAAGESTRVELVVDSAASNHPFSIWDVDRDTWVAPKGATRSRSAPRRATSTSPTRCS